MTIIPHLESQSLQSKFFLLLNPIEKATIFSPNLIYFPSTFPYFHSFQSDFHRTQIRNPIVCARKKRKPFGSQKIKKYFPKLIPAIASTLKILPEPLDLVIAEIGGGDGGNSGFWNGYGGGKFDGWRRKGYKILPLLIFCAVYGLGLLLFGKDLKNDTLYGVLALGLLVAILVNGFQRSVKDWVLDVCLIGALMGWRLRREDLQKWVEKIGVFSPFLELVKGKRRSRRRIL